jgi:hypothetical protein
MKVKYPIRYKFEPKNVDTSTRWLSLEVTNISPDVLTNLDIRLHSMDTYNLYVLGDGAFLSVLNPDEAKTVHFNISAVRSTSVYITMDGLRDGFAFSWESPLEYISVGKEAARLTSLFAMTEPYPPIGETIRCEATIRGVSSTGGLTLEFWSNSPTGEFEKIGTMETKSLSPTETATYSAEFEPDEEGLYNIYAYLFDNGSRIGRKTEVVYVKEA